MRRWLVLASLMLGACAGRPYVEALNPLHPNWDVEETAIDDQRVRIVLRMKPFYSGGAGEARVLFNQRAREVMRQNDFDDYQVVEYAEGLDSAVLGSRRTAEGVVKLTRKSG